MSSPLTYPLPLLPSITDDLENIDTRRALPHLMALMKNTFIRGLNRVYACAPLITPGHPVLPSFLDYIFSLLIHLNAHLEEDATFFSMNALLGISTCETNPDTMAIRESISSLLNLVSGWTKVVSRLLLFMLLTCAQDESAYRPSSLCDGLLFGPSLVAVMQGQIKMLTPTLLGSVISHLDLLELIEGSISRISERSDMSFLLPFILSHHDRTTSAKWPNINEHGIDMLPTLMLSHPGCWQFAPFNPLTRDIQDFGTISPDS